MIYKDTDTGEAFLSRDSVRWDGVKPEVKQIAAWIEQYTERITGTDRYITSARRSIAEQQAAQDHLLTHYGQEYYNSVYQHQGQDVATMPHVEGRAVDRQYVDDRQILNVYNAINQAYKRELTEPLGYTPSSLIVVEGGNCIHIQIPRQIPDSKAYMNTVKEIIVNLTT